MVWCLHLSLPGLSWGAGGYAGGLRAGKHSYYEGGPRVPFLVRWPGQIPAGRVNDQSVMSALDWLPTICSLAGCDIPWDKIEGEDMSDVLFGSSRSRTNPVFWRGICPSDCRHRLIMRYDKWKLFAHDEELYNLSVDRGERWNVYSNNSDVVETLLDSMKTWEAKLPTGHSRLPADPLPFDADAPAPQILLPCLETSFTTAMNPSCQLHQVPFQAHPTSYCAYTKDPDDTESHSTIGNCDLSSDSSSRLQLSQGTNSQQKDDGTSFSTTCPGGCFLGFTNPETFVEFNFITKYAEETVLISASVASAESRLFQLLLVNEEDVNRGREFLAPGLGTEEFRSTEWAVTLKRPGLHRLRFVVTDGDVQLCSISVEQLQAATYPTPTPSEQKPAIDCPPIGSDQTDYVFSSDDEESSSPKTLFANWFSMMTCIPFFMLVLWL